MNRAGPLFSELSLPVALVQTLRRLNPWWEGLPSAPQPATRRHLVRQLRSRLDRRIAPIIVLRGPRQIGKTVAQLQLLGDLLLEGMEPNRILRVQFDELSALERLEDPILRVVEWFERTVLGSTLNEAARSGRPAYLFFDEVQNLRGWAPQLKSLVDSSSVQVVVTGSSALRIEIGRDSLAGRISTIEAGVLSLTEIGRFRGVDVGEPLLPDNGLEPLTRRDFWLEVREAGSTRAAERDQAFAWFSERGGYPVVHKRPDLDWSFLATQLNEDVIRRVIQHDLRTGDRGRKRDAPLLEELFRMSCRYVGQAPGASLLAREAQRALGANVGSTRVLNYLRFLGDSLLLRLVEPLEIRLKRRRGSPKLCLADHGLRASWLQEQVPLDPSELARQPELTVLAGRIAESVVGATLSTIPSLGLTHVPARPAEPEIDFVLTIRTRRIPLEVKYQRRIDPLADTEGLRTFIERSVNNAPFGVLVTQADETPVLDPRIIALPLSSLMLLR